jgi:hypothetical protein
MKLSEITETVRAATNHAESYEKVLTDVTTLAVTGYGARGTASGQSPDSELDDIDAAHLIGFLIETTPDATAAEGGMKGIIPNEHVGRAVNVAIDEQSWATGVIRYGDSSSIYVHFEEYPELDGHYPRKSVTLISVTATERVEKIADVMRAAHTDAIKDLNGAINDLRNEGAQAAAVLDFDRCNRKFTAASKLSEFRHEASKTRGTVNFPLAQARFMARIGRMSGVIFAAGGLNAPNEAEAVTELIEAGWVEMVRETRTAREVIYYAISGYRSV